MPDDVKSRPYDNARRRAASDATRKRILDAARELLLSGGYRATTVARIADSAGVHVATVYELVGRKPVILRELIEHALSGSDVVVAADDRDYVVAIRAEPDPRRKLAIYARATREIHGRLAPLLLALRDAATTEPEALEVWRAIGERRAANMRRFVADILTSGRLRSGLSVDDAADTIWATNSAEMYVLLTTERGWSPDRYERWLAESWCHLLLPDG